MAGSGARATRRNDERGVNVDGGMQNYGRHVIVRVQDRVRVYGNWGREERRDMYSKI